VEQTQKTEDRSFIREGRGGRAGIAVGGGGKFESQGSYHLILPGKKGMEKGSPFQISTC